MLFTTDSPCWTTSSVNRSLFAAITLHYVQRSLIYCPLTSRGAKPIPLAPYLSAMAFTIFNGFMQNRYLLSYQCYAEEWMKTPQFVLGLIFLLLEWPLTFTQISYWLDCANPVKLATRYRLEASTITWLEPTFSVNRSSGADWHWLHAAAQQLRLPSLVLLSWVSELTTITATIFEKFKNYPRNRKVFIPYFLWWVETFYLLHSSDSTIADRISNYPVMIKRYIEVLFFVHFSIFAVNRRVFTKMYSSSLFILK